MRRFTLQTGRAIYDKDTAKEAGMEDSQYLSLNLDKGSVRIYDFGAVKLHAYRTRDPMDDESFLLEKQGRAFVLEPPCFADNIRELSRYIVGQSLAVDGVVAAYHMAGATFLPDTPRYSTKRAVEYGTEGHGKALVEGFAMAFGEDFDPSLPKASQCKHIRGSSLTLAGIKLKIIPTGDAFDVEIPEIGAAYVHMLGAASHSIIAGHAHGKQMVERLRGLRRQQYQLILSSHSEPETVDDASVKIAYLRDVMDLAAVSRTAGDFMAAAKERYPNYAGENYLEMTASLLFPSPAPPC
ncbi:hypothetical protein FACS1894186_2870 [Alphaproteobacteria bacterium]|nr:hypothetical protein FACS1894186_2870 [Alphaproteobacteria bacterium]